MVAKISKLFPCLRFFAVWKIGYFFLFWTGFVCFVLSVCTCTQQIFWPLHWSLLWSLLLSYFNTPPYKHCFTQKKLWYITRLLHKWTGYCEFCIPFQNRTFSIIFAISKGRGLIARNTGIISSYTRDCTSRNVEPTCLCLFFMRKCFQLNGENPTDTTWADHKRSSTGPKPNNPLFRPPAHNGPNRNQSHQVLSQLFLH